jgi:hypothetical protein
MRAFVVVPADEFGEYTPKMSFIPDQHAVETLPAKRPYQPLDVCRRIGRAIWNRDPPDAQSLQIFESKDQNSRSAFLSIGFFDLREDTIRYPEGFPEK